MSEIGNTSGGSNRSDPEFMKSNHRRFVEALTECQEPLRAYCFAKVGNWADASDVLQATNVKLWEKMEDWDQMRPFLPWAIGVARKPTQGS